MITTNNINQAQKQIEKLFNNKEEIVVLSQDDEFNRKILENKKVDVLLLNEDLNVKDYMKQRNSQLNEVLCKLAKNNDIKIAVDMNKIIKKDKLEKAKALARLKQNIDLCKRVKTKIIIYGDFEKRLILSLFLTLGASTSQAKTAVEESFFK